MTIDLLTQMNEVFTKCMNDTKDMPDEIRLYEGDEDPFEWWRGAKYKGVEIEWAGSIGDYDD